MLALADQDGEVIGSPVGLARQANVKLDECLAALDDLQKPDPFSGNPAESGRRVLPIRGGWKVVTYQEHRDLMSLEDRRARDAKRKADRRAKNRAAAEMSHAHSDVSEFVRDVSQAEANTEAEAKAEADSGSLKAEAKTQEVDRSGGSGRTPRKRGSSTQGTRLPDDWAPIPERDKVAELEARLSQLGGNPDVCRVEFSNYWHSRPGAGARKLDWNKTYANRLLEWIGRLRPAGARQRASETDTQRLLRQIAEMEKSA